MAVFVFKDMTGEAAGWSAMQQREDIRTDVDSLRCTPLLRLVHFCAYKTREDMCISIKP